MVVIKLDLGAMERLFDTDEAKVELQQCVMAEFMRRHFNKVVTQKTAELISKYDAALQKQIEAATKEVVGKVTGHWTTERFVFTPEVLTTLSAAVSQKFNALVGKYVDCKKEDIDRFIKFRLDYNIKAEVDRQFKEKMESIKKAVQ